MRKEYILALRSKAASGDSKAIEALDRLRERDRERKKKVYEKAESGDPAAVASLDRKRTKMRAYQSAARKPPTVLGSLRNRVGVALKCLLAKFR